MSVFGSIMSAVFSKPAAAQAPPPPAASGPAPAQTKGSSAPSATPSQTTASSPAAAAAPAATTGASTAPPSSIDVAAVLTGLAAQSKEKLDWRRSIVDLMKLLKIDSSLSARKQLAQELHYSGDMNDSATLNVWLHKQVMIKLAENGGKVPEELKH